MKTIIIITLHPSLNRGWEGNKERKKNNEKYTARSHKIIKVEQRHENPKRGKKEPPMESKRREDFDRKDKSKDVTNLIYQQYRIKYIWMSFQFPSPRSHLPFPRVCSTRDPKQKSMCLLKKPKGQIERFFGDTRKEREGLLS